MECSWRLFLAGTLLCTGIGYLLGVRGRGELSAADRAALTVYRDRDSARAADWVTVSSQLMASARRVSELDSLNRLLGRRVRDREGVIVAATQTADSLKRLRLAEQDTGKKLGLCEQEVAALENRCAALAASKADLEQMLRNDTAATRERDTTIATLRRKVADDSTHHVTQTLPLIARLEKAAEPCGSFDSGCIDGLGGWNFTSSRPVVGASIPVARVKVLFLRLQLRGAAVWEF